MEPQRFRRRRRGRKARKKQIAFLIVAAILIGGFVWTRILVDRHQDATIFTDTTAATAPETEVDPKVAAPGVTKNLVLFVGTGFGIVPMTATRIYASGEDGALAVDLLPETALVRTASKNAQTADGAAAMTAYVTGIRVENGVLSQTADTRPYDEAGRMHAAHGETTCPSVGNGKPVATLLELAKAAGRSIGVVTTARVTQPIAAATYAHLCQRDGENTIAAQLAPGGNGANAKLVDGVDVVLGGGWEPFLPKEDPRGSSRNDTRDLFAEMRAKGYAVITRQAELAALPRKDAPAKLLGLFNRSQMTYDSDRNGTNEPSLAEMTSRAIDLLGRNDRGYVLVVEGGRIANAFDASLAAKGLQEARAFDDAVAATIAKVRELDPDYQHTTIVVTSDHDHTLIMNGNATLAQRTSVTRPGVLGVLRSYEEPTQPAVDAGGRPYPTLVFATGTKRVKGSRSQAPPLTDLALSERNVRYEAAIETPTATGGSDVMLGAMGANAARFHGTIDNTQVFALLREAMGL